MEVGPNVLHLPGLAADAHHLLGVPWHCVDAVANCDCRMVLVSSIEVGPNELHLPGLAADAHHLLG
eukprot:3825008-Amphidinium_carterae.1